MKIPILLVAILAGLTSWIRLICAFRHSDIATLENLTFCISHFSFSGWLFALVLVIVWWIVLNTCVARWVGSKVRNSAN